MRNLIAKKDIPTPTRFFHKLALGMGALAFISSVLTFLNLNNEETKVLDTEKFTGEPDSKPTSQLV